MNGFKRLIVISGSSLLFLPTGRSLATPMKFPQLGIPVICHLQRMQQYPDTDLDGRGLLNSHMQMTPFDRPIDRYLQKRQYLLAQQLAEASNSPAVRLATLQQIINRLTQAGRTAETKPFVDQMAILVPQVARPDAPLLSHDLWLDLGQRHLQLGERERAIAALNQAAKMVQGVTETFSFKAPTPKAMLLEAVAAALITAKQPTSALPLLAQSLSSADKLQPQQRIPLLTDLSLDYGRLGQSDTATQLLERSLMAARSLPSRSSHDVAFSQIYGYQVILNRLVAADQAQTALRVIDEMVARAKPDGQSRSDLSENQVFRAAIAPLLQLGQVTKAVEFARRLNQQDQFAANQAIALYYHRQKQPQTALNLLAQNRQMLSGLARPYDRANRTVELVGSYLEIGQFEQAISLAQQARQAGWATPSQFETMMAQSIQHLILAQQFDRANTLLRTQQPRTDDWQWLKVAMTYLQMEQWSAAIRLVESLKDDSSRYQGLREIILTATEAGHYQAAHRLAKKLSPQDADTAPLLHLLNCATPK